MEAYSPLMRRATVVLPVPGLPMNTMCSDIGGTGSSFSCRRRRTFIRFMRFLTSFLTSSSPTSASSCAISSSKSGFFSGAAAAAVEAPCPPAVWGCGCLSIKLGSPLVTKSSALRPALLFFTPLVSQMAVSLSLHSVINSASA